MSNFNSYRYALVEPDKLSPKQHRQLRALTGRSVALDFPRRSRSEIGNFVAFADQHRTNLNGMVGSENFGGAKQRFANARYVLASRRTAGNSEIVAALRVADHASARLPRPLSSIELGLKLHNDRFIANRYYYAGMCIMNEEVRESLRVGAAEEPKVTDVLLVAGTADRLPQLVGTAYPYTNEADWQFALERMEYSNDGRVPSVQPFGPGTSRVGIDRWVGDTVESIRTQGLSMEGMAEVLARSGIILESPTTA